MTKKAIVQVGTAPDHVKEILREHDGTALANYKRAVLVRMEEPGLQRLRDEGFAVREIEDEPVLQIGAFYVDTTVSDTPLPAAAAGPPASGQEHFVLRLVGPMHPTWKRKLDKLGVQLRESLGPFTYLATFDAGRRAQVARLKFVETVSRFSAALKVSPHLITDGVEGSLAAADPALRLAARAASPPPPAAATTELSESVIRRTPAPDPETTGNLEVQCFDAGDQLAVCDALREMGVRIIRTEGDVIIALADLARLPEIAEISHVRQINPYRPPEITNNVASGIIQVDALRNDLGLDGTGQVVAVADTGLDRGVDDQTMLADFRGRVVNIHALGRPGDASDIDNHGTHVAGSVLGDGANSLGRSAAWLPRRGSCFSPS